MKHIQEAMYIFINHNAVAVNYSYVMVADKQLYSACIHLIFSQLKHWFYFYFTSLKAIAKDTHWLADFQTPCVVNKKNIYWDKT